MMATYGAPYAAIYSHGGVYAHPAIPIVSLHFFNNLVVDIIQGVLQCFLT